MAQRTESEGNRSGRLFAQQLPLDGSASTGASKAGGVLDCFRAAGTYSAGVVVAGVTGAEPLSSTGGVQPATMLTQKTTRLQTTRVVRFDIPEYLAWCQTTGCKHSILNGPPGEHNGALRPKSPPSSVGCITALPQGHSI